MISIIISFLVYFLLVFWLYFFAIKMVSDEINPNFIRLFILSSLLTVYAYFSYTLHWNIPILITLIMWFIIFFILWVGFLDYIYISIIVWIWSIAAINFLDKIIELINKFI